MTDTTTTEDKKGKNAGVTWPECIRDVVYKAIDSGQIIPVSVFFCLVVYIWRLPEDELGEFGRLVIVGLENYSLAGWSLAVFCISWWGRSVKKMKAKHSLECKRIGDEKSQLQKGQVNVTELGSSADS